MHAALVPVRSLAGAKRRLATSLAEADRIELALAMLQDMVDALEAAPSVGRVVVLSADPLLLEHASSCGAETMREGTPKGLNAAVASAAATLATSGVTRLLTIPGDVPLLEPADIESAFATDPDAYPIVLVPSASGTGTNGLLTSPPTILAPAFEGESLAAHRSAAAGARLASLTLDLESFALDVDTPEDLSVLAASAAPKRSVAFAARSRTAA
jgi:2-phospho-L-lactate guanylyltransferase